MAFNLCHRRWPAFVNLTSLDLSGNRIAADGAQALADLVSLTSLNLSGNKIGPEGAQALADLVNLTSLDLWYLGYDEEGAIGPFGGQALKQLINLTSLNLSGNIIRAKGAQALSGLRNLTSLNFASQSDWQRRRVGAVRVSQPPTSLDLTNLNAIDNDPGIGPEGAKAIGRTLLI